MARVSLGINYENVPQAFLSAAQQSFREHSKSGNAHSQPSSSTTTASIPSTMAPLPDINISVSPSMPNIQTYDALSISSPSSVQATSPIPDLGMAELSPLASGANLNIGQSFDSRLFASHVGNTNENSGEFVQMC